MARAGTDVRACRNLRSSHVGQRHVVDPAGPGTYPVSLSTQQQSGGVLANVFRVYAKGIAKDEQWEHLGLSDRVTGILVTVQAEASAPGVTGAGSPDARVVDRLEKALHAGDPPESWRVTKTFGVTTDFGNGVVSFDLHIGLGLNIFSVSAKGLSELGDGTGALAKPCGFSDPQRMYFTITGSAQ